VADIVEELKILIQKGEALAASGADKITENQKNWLKNTAEFLQINQLEGFVAEHCFAFIGEVKEQLKCLKNLLELEHALNVGLIFKKKMDSILIYILKILEQKNLDAIDWLYAAVGEENVREVIQRAVIPEKLSNIVFTSTFGKYSLGVRYEGDYLTLQGKERLSSLMSSNKSAKIDDLDLERYFSTDDFNPLIHSLTFLHEDYANILSQTLSEIQIDIKNNAPMSAIAMARRGLEIILIALANEKREDFCSVASEFSRKKEIERWSLADLITSAEKLGYFRKDVEQFQIINTIREFGNYVHPANEINSKFRPDIHTAKMCFEAVIATIKHMGSIT
jgi:hypothetical protein